MRIICLTNSSKNSGRCISGIEVSTGEWVRPVDKNMEDGRIPGTITYSDGRELKTLDIVDIPISNEKYGDEKENKVVLGYQWKYIAKAKVSDIRPYCDASILYSQNEDFLNFIPHLYLKSLAVENRRTLQVIETSNFSAYINQYGKKRGKIPLKSGKTLDLPITDPEMYSRLDAREKISPHCLIVLSFGQPWSSKEDGDKLCYRLIASVLEL
jgi:hypothetical protein